MYLLHCQAEARNKKNTAYVRNTYYKLMKKYLRVLYPYSLVS